MRRRRRFHDRMAGYPWPVERFRVVVPPGRLYANAPPPAKAILGGGWVNNFFNCDRPFRLNHAHQVTKCTLRELADQWRDDVRKRRSSTIQARFHGAEIYTGDFGDFLVRLAFQFAQHKYLTVMRRQLSDRLLHHLL